VSAVQQPARAQFLLRFDDLCPTMDRARWEWYLPLIARYRLKPILAVVPDNQDPELNRGPVHVGFWGEMRGLQADGATIGMHGYQHLCLTDGAGLIPMHRQTEFAGAPKDCQREWIRAGLTILRGHGLRPTVWVAPRHGFDRVTLEILRDEGIDVVSDGFASRPFRRSGVTWIPQQLWGPEQRRSGLWTICVHPNTADERAASQLGGVSGAICGAVYFGGAGAD